MDTSRADATGLTAAQRRVLLAADAETGEVSGSAAVRDALVARGLAARYGARGAVYLTTRGRGMRDAAGEAGDEVRDGGAEEPGGGDAQPGEAAGFVPATGDGADPPPHGPERAAEVAAAWRALVAVRELTGSGAVPAAWERHPGRLVRAVSLALESAGLPPSALGARGRRTRAGYHVTADPDPGPGAGTIQVRWAGPVAPREAGARLADCAAALTARGWNSLTYIGPRRIPYLVVTPVS